MEEIKYRTINWRKIFCVLWAKKILIMLLSLLCALIFLLGTFFFVTPKYQADILIYVNNSSASHGNNSLAFNLGELTAARQMLNTYLVVLKSRQFLDRVIEKADLNCSRSQLKSMISAGSVNDTQVFNVIVTSTDPNEACLIANAIAEDFPELLTKTIKGSSVEVIDSAANSASKVSPVMSKVGLIGFALGFIWSCVYIIIREIFDDKVHDESTLTEMFEDIPVLANIPFRTSEGNFRKNRRFAHKK